MFNYAILLSIFTCSLYLRCNPFLLPVYTPPPHPSVFLHLVYLSAPQTLLWSLCMLITGGLVCSGEPW